MAKSSKRRRSTNPKDARPSLFFIIVLALGIVFLVILFITGIGRSAPPGLPGSPPTQR
ncbi:MAG TPA: hypothetical protein VGF40_07450 [Thermoanaerobaculia bacterium]